MEENAKLQQPVSATFTHPSGQTTEVVGTLESVFATMQQLSQAAADVLLCDTCKHNGDPACTEAQAARGLPHTCEKHEPKAPPPSPADIAQVASNAGMITGYRQALAQVAENLRKQAAELRAPGEAQAALLERCAAVVEAQCAAQAGQQAELQRTYEAVLAECNAKG
ncbi:MAG: hypothetical protein ACYC6C_10750 [Coriobacteriia bacterium]